MCGTYVSSFCFSDHLYQIASPNGGARLLFTEVDSGCGIYQLVAQLDRNGNLTAVYGRDGKKNCTVSPTATTSWSITGTSATACKRFTRKIEKRLSKSISVGGYSFANSPKRLNWEVL